MLMTVLTPSRLRVSNPLLPSGCPPLSRRGLSRNTFSIPGASIRSGCSLWLPGASTCRCWGLAPSITRARRIDETVLPSTISDPPGDLREAAKLGLTEG
jgi:hypothetical protein